MTNRCRFLVVITLLCAVGSVIRGLDAMSILSLSLLVYIGATWCIFQTKSFILWEQLECTRTINGRESNRSVTLWADRSAAIEVQLRARRGHFSPMVIVGDWVPDILRLTSGACSHLVVEQTSLITLQYSAQVLAAGRTRFPGVFLRFRDPMGLFLIEKFLESPAEIHCLPSFDARATMQASVKRLNSLPQHGIHRLQRAGLGSELLELREYQSGDPPKSIAWKVSARRDRLMTRQYESEVPVRVNLFLDGSGAVRQGELSRRGLDQLNRVAASIANAAVRSGDQVGLVTIDEQGVSSIKPAYGQRAFLECQRNLATFSLQPKKEAAFITSASIQQLVDICRVRYPDLLHPDVNLVPFTLLPLRPAKRRAWQNRCRIAIVIASLKCLDAIQCSRLCFDDDFFYHHARQLLVSNGRQFTPLAQSRSSSPPPWNWSESLGRCICTAITRARDNEVIVILTDLINRESQLEDLLQHVKVAIGRHHRVVFICPRRLDTEIIIPQKMLRTRQRAYHAPSVIEADILSRAARSRQSSAQRRIQRAVRRLGAHVGFVDTDTATTMVMEQASLAGSGRSSAGSQR